MSDGSGNTGLKAVEKLTIMGSHEKYGGSDEWYTPKYVFDALDTHFDMDVAAAPPGLGFVPATVMCRDGLNSIWNGFSWCNPPFAGRGKKDPWIEKMFRHGDGILLTPDRSSAPWWQHAAKISNSLLMVNGKIKFIPGEGNLSNSKQPGSGTTLFAFGVRAIRALQNAEKNKLGLVFKR